MKSAFGSAQGLYAHNRREITRQICLCIAMLMASVAVVVLNSLHDCQALLDIGLMWVFVVIGAAVLVLGERNQNVFYEEYQLPRWHLRQQG